jgi:predicted molibdopterin-dependent oxidoreductase YjgC
VITPPGDAQEDWQVFVNVGLALGAQMTYATSSEVRSEIAAAMSANPGYDGLTTLEFARPVAASHWLQASNPSERWKWDLMFQDLPPVKFASTPRATAARPAIPLQPVA